MLYIANALLWCYVVHAMSYHLNASRVSEVENDTLRNTNSQGPPRGPPGDPHGLLHMLGVGGVTGSGRVQVGGVGRQAFKYM